MNLAIVGSRDFADEAVIRRSIERWQQLEPDLTIVSGGARGADSIAERIAKQLGLPTIVHPARWETHGRSAGYLRNRDIVADADVVLAYFAPGPLSRGTSHTVDLARAARKPVHIFHEGRWS